MHKLAKAVLSSHGLVWAKQSVRAKEELALRSKAHILARQQELRDEYQSLEAELALLQVNIAESAADARPITMSSAALTSIDLEIFDRLYSDPAWSSRTRIEMARRDVARAPAPEPIVGKGLPTWSRVEPEMPQWARDVAKHRDLFQGNALVVRGADGGEEYWKVIYCVQSPQVYVAVARMEVQEYVHPVTSLPCSMRQASIDYMTQLFRCNFGVLQTAANMPPASLDSMMLLQGLKHLGGTRIGASWGEPDHIGVLMRGVGQEKTGSRKRSREVASKEDRDYEALLENYPWLVHLDQDAGFRTQTQRVVAQASSSSDAGLPEMPTVTEDDLFAGLADMERARAAEVVVASERGFRDFVLTHRGGRRHLAKEGVWGDAVQSKSLKDGHDWAKKNGFNVTFKATFTDELPEDTCRILGRAWCHRMQYFFDLAVEAGNMRLPYTAAMIGKYQEPAEVTALGTPTGNPQLLERLRVLRSFP